MATPSWKKVVSQNISKQKSNSITILVFKNNWNGRKTWSKEEQNRKETKKQSSKWKPAYTYSEGKYLKIAASQSGKTKEIWKNKG